ncbi:ATP-grasp domain-containing protein [Nocardia sp. NBC_01730]|uniref:ATP-grasp domain-containing protein n=1 Tax=Nocardia sp. NBC_01730 TaxID=2975998 RepID=UPI002E11FBB1|nr:ATP-grasp domain-containing protein [Nocardia sp. NBC_01730]
MLLYLLALNPTDSVSEGFLPAAATLGMEVTILTDQPDPHRTRHPDITVVRCDLRSSDAVVATIAALPAPDVIFTNSDHLQAQAALAAAYFGLPGKDWRTAWRVKNKAEMRRRLTACGLDVVWHAELLQDRNPDALTALDVPFPCVVKPREGVASEDVVQVGRMTDLLRCCKEIRHRRPNTALVVEEYLDGDLCTLETLGDAQRRQVLGGFLTRLSAAPHFIELRHTFTAAHPQPVTDQVMAQLDALGIGFGSCHTEFVVTNGRARLIEVNYRSIGDQCDLLLQDALEIPLFERILRTHLGEPLPDDLGFRTDRAARIDHVCAPASGTLISAPAAADLVVDGVALSYRPLREIGTPHELAHTNRDYVGVLRAVGNCSAAVDQAAEQFLAGQRWEVAS